MAIICWPCYQATHPQDSRAPVTWWHVMPAVEATCTRCQTVQLCANLRRAEPDSGRRQETERAKAAA